MGHPLWECFFQYFTLCRGSGSSTFRFTVYRIQIQSSVGETTVKCKASECGTTAPAHCVRYYCTSALSLHWLLWPICFSFGLLNEVIDAFGAFAPTPTSFYSGVSGVMPRILEIQFYVEFSLDELSIFFTSSLSFDGFSS